MEVRAWKAAACAQEGLVVGERRPGVVLVEEGRGSTVAPSAGAAVRTCSGALEGSGAVWACVTEALEARTWMQAQARELAYMAEVQGAPVVLGLGPAQAREGGLGCRSQRAFAGGEGLRTQEVCESEWGHTFRMAG